MNTLFVKPAAGLTVIDPASGSALPETGERVEKSAYWLRRLQSGEVVEIESENPEKGKEK